MGVLIAIGITLAVVVLAVLGTVWSGRAARSHDESFATWAADRGMRCEVGPSDPPNADLELLQVRPRHTKVRRRIWPDDGPDSAFQLHVAGSDAARRWSCGLTTLPVRVGRVKVEAATATKKMRDDLRRREDSVELPDLGERWVVTADDAEFAHDLLDDAVVSWFLEMASLYPSHRVSAEFHDTWLFVRCEPLPEERTELALDWARDLRRLVIDGSAHRSPPWNGSPTGEA